MLRWLSRSRPDQRPVTPHTVFRRLEHAVSTVEGDRTVLLDPVKGEYLGLDEVGTRIWELLPEHSSAAALADRLFEEYDAPRERLEADAAALLAELTRHGLVVRE